MNIARTLLRARQWLTCALVTLAASAAFAVSAQPLADDEDPPGRVGRLAGLQGSVSWFDAEQGEWDEAERNRPLTTADRVSTAPGARAELRVGSTVVRLGGGTELEVLRLDDDSIRLQLHSGSLALRVRSREVAAEIELVTQEANLQPQRAGHYRLDREDDITQATVWRGTLKVDDERGFRVETGQRVELWREGRGERAELRHDWKNPQLSDEFSAWVLSDEQREERSASTRYVSPEMTGFEELDRKRPMGPAPRLRPGLDATDRARDWAPYRQGQWAWVRPWGWTWVDDAALGLRSVPLRSLDQLAQPLVLGARQLPGASGVCAGAGGVARRTLGGACRSTLVGRPSAGCRWHPMSSSCRTTAARHGTATASTNTRAAPATARRRRCPPAR
jgi:hypothetical protein